MLKNNAERFGLNCIRRSVYPEGWRASGEHPVWKSMKTDSASQSTKANLVAKKAQVEFFLGYFHLLCIRDRSEPYQSFSRIPSWFPNDLITFQPYWSKVGESFFFLKKESFINPVSLIDTRPSAFFTSLVDFAHCFPFYRLPLWRGSARDQVIHMRKKKESNPNLFQLGPGYPTGAGRQVDARSTEKIEFLFLGHE